MDRSYAIAYGTRNSVSTTTFAVYINFKLWISNLLGYPKPAGGVAVGNAWIATEHCSKSLGFYLPIHMINVLLKFEFDVQSQSPPTLLGRSIKKKFYDLAKTNPEL